jgi:hypothetical protein
MNTPIPTTCGRLSISVKFCHVSVIPMPNMTIPKSGTIAGLKPANSVGKANAMNENNSAQSGKRLVTRCAIMLLGSGVIHT